jgi:hypothetical protein
LEHFSRLPDFEFLANDGELGGRFDPQADSAAGQAHDRDADFVSDPNALADFAT